MHSFVFFESLNSYLQFNMYLNRYSHPVKASTLIECIHMFPIVHDELVKLGHEPFDEAYESDWHVNAVGLDVCGWDGETVGAVVGDTRVNSLENELGSVLAMKLDFRYKYFVAMFLLFGAVLVIFGYPMK